MTTQTPKNIQNQPTNEAVAIDRRKVVAAVAGAGVASSALGGSVNARDTSDKTEFEGRTAFVTGGARGIGLACAEALAQAGANIVLYDIADQIDIVPYQLATESDLNNAKSKIESLGVNCIAIKGDVRDADRQKYAVAQAVKEFGGVDFVVANAGITQIGPIESFSEDQISVVLDINLAGAIKTVQATVPVLQENEFGRIIVMSSVTGRRGSASFPIYSASKWGAIGLAKSTALALGKANVTCNAVCPTLIHTKLLDNPYILGALGADSFETFEQAAQGQHVLPVGFMQSPDVAELVKFLCSDAAALISGDVFDFGAGANANFPA